MHVKSLLHLIFFVVVCNVLYAQVPNISYSSSQTYTVKTAITPLSPTNTGGAVPATVYGQVISDPINFGIDPTILDNMFNKKNVDAAGNSYGAYGPAENIIAVLINNQPGSPINWFPAIWVTNTAFGSLQQGALDKYGNFYIPDGSNGVIWKVTPVPGTKAFSYVHEPTLRRPFRWIYKAIKRKPV